MDAKIAILGGGLAGLQCARLLRGRGVDCAVLEARDKPGGLCRTIRRGAYTWDIGPHAFYSRDPGIMENYRSLPLDYRDLERRVRVCHRDRGGRISEVGYPFENGLADLPLRDRLECLAGYALVRGGAGREFDNLEDWIRRGLGPGIAKHFMLPYNGKIWDCPLGGISMDLVKRKIEPEPVWKVLRNGFVKGTVGRSYQAKFIYPRGGAGMLTDAVAAEVGEDLVTGWRVKRLEEAGRFWRIVPEDGPPILAESVISTIPIPELLAALGDRELLEAVPHFKSNDTYFAAIGLKEGRSFGRFGDCQWVFFAGPELFYRATLMHNFDADRLPTLVAEVTRKTGEGAPEISREAVVTRTLDGLLALGMLEDARDVALAEAHLEKYTYPIPTVGLDHSRDFVETRLARRRVYLLGRSGRWDYVNTDGIFARAAAFVEENARLLGAPS